MATCNSPYLFKRLAGQLLAALVLYMALASMLPIVGASLFAGMLLWSHAGIWYCWIIQMAFIAVTVELRGALAQKAAHWLTRVPHTRLRQVLVLANVLVAWVMLSSYILLVQTLPVFSIALAIELFLLLVQVWCLCGAAVPMSAKRFYTYFFKQPFYLPENSKWQYKIPF